ncbi:hypothetical protein [Streptomyces sp. NPDC058441]|uniref:hypothetical protein n=1 Tax=Streptomyces sp. NPDC058441 TaxID=3346502 RepID=UPI00364BBE85
MAGEPKAVPAVSDAPTQGLSLVAEVAIVIVEVMAIRENGSGRNSVIITRSC